MHFLKGFTYRREVHSWGYCNFTSVTSNQGIKAAGLLLREITEVKAFHGRQIDAIHLRDGASPRLTGKRAPAWGTGWSEIRSKTWHWAHQNPAAALCSLRQQSRSDCQDAHEAERCWQVIFPPPDRQEGRERPSNSGWANRSIGSAWGDLITLSDIFRFTFLNYSLHSTLGTKHKRYSHLITFTT